MNSFFSNTIKRLLACGAAIGFLTTGMMTVHAQGFYFDFTAGSYTVVLGGYVSGSMAMYSVSDIYDNDYDGYGDTYYGYYTDWYVHSSSGYDAPTEVTISGSGGSQEVDWPAGNYGTENFSIYVPNSGSPGYDTTATLSVDNYDPYANDPYDSIIDGNPYYYYCEYNYSYYGDTPSTATVTVLNPNTVMNVEINGSSQLTESESQQTTYIRIYRADSYNTRTVYYTITGNAVAGSDYTAPWSGNIGSVTIPAGSEYVDIPVSTLNNIPFSKTLTLTLNSDSLGSYQIGANNTVTITLLPYDQNTSDDSDNTDDEDMGDAQLFQSATPAFNGLNVSHQKGGYGTATNGVVNLPFAFMNVQAVSPYATGIGPTPGLFTITRSGGTNAFTLNYTVTGTAIAGSNYVALPVSVQFGTNQTSTNLSVNVLTNLPLTAAQTVVLTLNISSNYFLGYSPQAVVTLLPNSSLTNSVASPAGRYWRGSGSDPTYWSQVIPLDYETGTVYSNTNGNAATLYPGLSSGAWSSQMLYHYNATNSLPQTNIANRIAFNNPIVAFGERIGGTPLYFSQPYNFGIYAGDPLLATTQIVIQVYYRTNDQLAGSIKVVPPNYFNTNSMLSYVTNAFQVTTNAFGLSTTLSDSPSLNWGATSLGAYVLTHTASSLATNYYYLVEVSGYPAAGSNAMAITASNAVAPSLLYSLEFEARPPWRSIFLDQPQFAGSPLPPFYAGKTLAEMLTNTPPVTNVVNFTPSAATNLDDSPELRRHPTLDNFVASMGNDPIALANYVINNIDLTDPMDYSDSGNIAEQAINPGGVSRGALGTFMEKQGSAVDQCALLVYLLRQAGVPAVYEFAPRNGLQILDARLSQMLKFQVQGAVKRSGPALHHQHDDCGELSVGCRLHRDQLGAYLSVVERLRNHRGIESLRLYAHELFQRLSVGAGLHLRQHQPAVAGGGRRQHAARHLPRISETDVAAKSSRHFRGRHRGADSQPAALLFTLAGFSDPDLGDECQHVIGKSDFQRHHQHQPDADQHFRHGERGNLQRHQPDQQHSDGQSAAGGLAQPGILHQPDHDQREPGAVKPDFAAVPHQHHDASLLSSTIPICCPRKC